MEISISNIEDAEQILRLQKLAYQSEAQIYHSNAIPPLKQTLDELKKEYDDHVFLKAAIEKGIVGSVRVLASKGTCHIGRLIVHPKQQGKGIGSMLLKSIETKFADARRYELFTGNLSTRNILLYERHGYRRFKEEKINGVVILIPKDEDPWKPLVDSLEKFSDDFFNFSREQGVLEKRKEIE